MSESEPGPDLELYVRRVQSDTRKLMQDLLAENERLRALAASVQADRDRLAEEAALLRREMEAQRERQARLETQLADAAAENRHFSEEFVVVEQQNSSLANLYVAMSRLHSTLDRDAVLSEVVDIVEFLVGCEQIALFDLDEGALALAASKGIDARRWGRVAPGEGIVGRTAVTGEAWFAEPGVPAPDELTACVPLRRDGRVAGVLALYRLLPQKGGKLEEVDHELLDLLGAQAANALYAASLATAASRSAAGS